MDTAPIGNSDLHASRLVYGCMRIAERSRRRGFAAIRAALDAGYTHFDHADIYGGGASETLFGQFLADNPGERERLVITSKCGIRLEGDPKERHPKRYDFSAAHIRRSVHGSLRRLNVEHLDLLLLHRPDFLMRADEVAEVFGSLKDAGKVGHFGVSNFSPSQVELLQSRLDDPLRVNQVEINLRNPSALTNGTLDQCQQLGITPQAWSPLAGVVHAADALDRDAAARLRSEIRRQSRQYDSAGWIVALAWLLRHPANISPIIGSTSSERISTAKTALELDYRRTDWYRLLEARLGAPVA